MCRHRNPIPNIKENTTKTVFRLACAMKLSLNHVCIVFFTLACLSYLYRWRSPTKKISGGQLLCAALAAAQAGGRWVKTVREQAPLNEKRKGETKEGVLDMVTDGDLKSHQAMMAVFSESFPGVKVDLKY